MRSSRLVRLGAAVTLLAPMGLGLVGFTWAPPAHAAHGSAGSPAPGHRGRLAGPARGHTGPPVPLRGGPAPWGWPPATPHLGPWANGNPNRLWSAVAQALGISDSALRSDLAQGMTLSDVAQAQNRSLAAVAQAVVATLEKPVQQARSSGRLSQTAARAIEAQIGAAVARLFGQSLENSATAPQNLTASESPSGVTLTWSAPATLSPTGYTILEAQGHAAALAPIETVPAATTSVTVSNLVPGTAYQFAVEAVSSSGQTLAPAQVAVDFGPVAGPAAVSALSLPSDGEAGSAVLTIPFAVMGGESVSFENLSALTVTDQSQGNLALPVTGVSTSGNALVLTVSLPAESAVSAEDQIAVTSNGSPVAQDSAGVAAPVNLGATL